MEYINLDRFGPIITDKLKGDEIYTLLWKSASQNDIVDVDLGAIKSMATFNAKQIFGKLYIKLGANVFFSKIRLKNASDDLKLIIKVGIQNALDNPQELK